MTEADPDAIGPGEGTEPVAGGRPLLTPPSRPVTLGTGFRARTGDPAMSRHILVPAAGAHR